MTDTPPAHSDPTYREGMPDAALTEVGDISAITELVGKSTHLKKFQRVVLIDGDWGADRLRVLAALYQTSMRTFDPARRWPSDLETGALAPLSIPPPQLQRENGLWIGVHATDDWVDALQIIAQIRQISHDPLAAAIVSPVPTNTGEAVAHALGFLDARSNLGAIELSQAMRLLAPGTDSHPLSPDAGLLGIGGPGTKAQALMLAGVIAHIADGRPVLLAIDGGGRIGGLLTSLVEHLQAQLPRFILVLAGPGDIKPVAPASLAGGGTNAVVRFRLSAGGPDLRAVSVMARRVIAELASAPGELFPKAFVARSIAQTEATIFVAEAIDELCSAGWLRRVAHDVVAFSDRHVRRGALGTSTPRLGGWPEAPDLTDEATVAFAAHVVASAAGTNGRARWRYVTGLARRGNPTQAAALGAGAAADQLERTISRIWALQPGQELDANPDLAGTTGADAAHQYLVIAAALADRSPDTARTLLEQAVPLLAASGDDPATDCLRLAAARIALHSGWVQLALDALRPLDETWIKPEIRAQLDDFAAMQDRPGLVARSVAVLCQLHAIAVLRAVMPNSEALGLMLLQRLETLELVDRLDTAPDAGSVAGEAVALFSQIAENVPYGQWRARRLQAWHAVVAGDAVVGIGNLRGVLADQQAALTPLDRAIGETMLSLGRAHLANGDFDEALRYLDSAINVLSASTESTENRAEWARHWHAVCKLNMGQPLDAAHELGNLIEALANRPPNDELLVASRQALGSALARSGEFDAALRVLDDVVTVRLTLDMPDAPRVLRARYSRASCLTFLNRHEEAIVELNAVIADATNSPAAGDTTRRAMNDRALCLLMTGQIPEALADLDVVVALAAAIGPPDDPSLLRARHQRAVCLEMMDRGADALTELDLVIAGAGPWSTDPVVAAAIERRRALAH